MTFTPISKLFETNSLKRAKIRTSDGHFMRTTSPILESCDTEPETNNVVIQKIGSLSIN